MTLWHRKFSNLESDEIFKAILKCEKDLIGEKEKNF